MSTPPTAPKEPSREAIEASVARRFAAIALRPDQDRRFPVGPASAKALGYDSTGIDALPPLATESFAGVGNPHGLGQARPGETVLDLGCGAGLDSLLAARCVGPGGRVIGVDMVPEMLEKARAAAAAARLRADFRDGRADRIPLPDASVDLVITNGVLNLCVDKPRVAAEMFRVLRPGGRLQMADVLLEDHVTPEEVDRKGEWSD
jgi:arsenite methyltransferase